MSVDTIYAESAETTESTENVAQPKRRESRRRSDIAVYVRFPGHVIQALDRLVDAERVDRGSSSRSDIMRALILEADRNARAGAREKESA